MTNFGIEKFMDTLLVSFKGSMLLSTSTTAQANGDRQEGQPTGRVGKPSDFAGLVLFLSSMASAHMTGNVIEIDGGSTLSGWRAKRKGSKI